MEGSRSGAESRPAHIITERTINFKLLDPNVCLMVEVGTRYHTS
jgi:hypothetical protein